MPLSKHFIAIAAAAVLAIATAVHLAEAQGGVGFSGGGFVGTGFAVGSHGGHGLGVGGFGKRRFGARPFAVVPHVRSAVTPHFGFGVGLFHHQLIRPQLVFRPPFIGPRPGRNFFGPKVITAGPRGFNVLGGSEGRRISVGPKVITAGTQAGKILVGSEDGRTLAGPRVIFVGPQGGNSLVGSEGGRILVRPLDGRILVGHQRGVFIN
jgi:hypothetical protein